MADAALDRSATLLANHPEIPDGCRPFELAGPVDVAEVFVDGTHVHTEQLGKLRLRQPDRFAVDADIQLKLASCSHVDGAVAARSDVAVCNSGGHPGYIDDSDAFHYLTDDGMTKILPSLDCSRLAKP